MLDIERLKVNMQNKKNENSKTFVKQELSKQQEQQQHKELMISDMSQFIAPPKDLIFLISNKCFYLRLYSNCL